MPGRIGFVLAWNHMAHFRHRRFRRPHHERPRTPPQDIDDPAKQASTGSEADYLRSLVDSRTAVTVVLLNGEELRGRIRYYDRDCFSVGPTDGGPKIFLRKSSVRYIVEG